MKKLLLLLLCAVWIVGAVAQPANDDCATATEITSGQLDDGNGGCITLVAEDNTNATPWSVPPNYVGNCWNGIDTLNVVFYYFEAQGVSGSVEITNGPDDYYVTVLEFNGAICDGTDITEWGCGDNAPILFDNDLTIGNFYYVAVAFANNSEGTFDLCVFNPVSAPNDECVNAIELTELDGSPCNGGQNNYYPSTETPIPGCFPADATQGVWFYFEAQGVSIADLHIENGPDVANVAVWDFSGQTVCDLQNGIVLACETNVDINNPIVLDNDLTIGNNYYIQVTFDNNATGGFDVCLDAPEQAFNDDCVDAVVYPTLELNEENNCLTNIAGDMLNNDWPSTDLFFPACWDPAFTYSVWFQFTAQGPDVDIEVDMPGADEQIAIVEFQGGNLCQAASAVVIECETGATLEVDNGLQVGATYYVMVGFDNNAVGDYCLNIFNPLPPDNDTACAAVALMTDGSCNSGPCPGPSGECYTTEYANPEFNPLSFPAECQANVENTVWFTVEMDDPNNVGFEINIEEITGSDFTVVIGTFNDCNGTFLVEDFFCDFDYPIEFGPVYDEDQVYYIMVGSSEDNEGSFNICVDEIEPCFENNFCEDQVGDSDAEEIVGVITDGGFVCVEGCNLWADPNTESNACGQDQSPTVWYTLTTDADAADMNIIVESDDMGAPTIVLYTGSCNGGLTPVPVNDGLGCAVGSGGQAIANTQVAPNETYYISVSGINTAGGDFEICVNTLFDASACVLQSSQEITDRSFGGPLEGPFFPGEEVTLCFTLAQYTPVGNGCQWFQGVVPVFGNGWDLSVFDPQGGATLNGSNYPAPGVYGGTWDWYADMTYNSDIAWYQLGDFDGNGTLDMCNSNFDPDCMGPGITGGMVMGACNIGGDVLPPGWFVSYPIDGCPQAGHPDVDWGDGNSCGSTMGPWEFCMDLKVRDFPDCQEDETTSDLSVTFFTFADGETGAWTGGPSTCAADQPETFIYPMCCSEQEFLPGDNIEACTPTVFSTLLDYPTVEFWEWTVDHGSAVIGPMGGSGPNGTQIVNTLENTGTSEELVTYNILGFAGGECPVASMMFNVLLYPELTVEMDPFTACATPFDPYELIPTVSGGQPSTYQYEWHDGSTDPTLLIDAPAVGQVYSVTVTDAIGCSGTAQVTLDVYETFPVDIDAPGVGQCFTDGPMTLNGSAEDGMPAYTFEWTSPMGNTSSGTSVEALEEGWWNLVATDSEGCMGEDSVQLDFYESPEVSVSPDVIAVCPDNPNPEQIIAIATGGTAPYEFTWTTPNGIFSTGFIWADVIGDYSIFVSDFNGCTAELSFNVEEAPSPVVDLGPDVLLCEEDLALGYNIEVPFDPTYQFYEWSTGDINSTLPVTETGTYQVTVTNAGGCIGTSEITIGTYEPIVDQFQDTVAFCEGGFGIIEGDASYDYQWSIGGSGPLVFVFDEGDVFVTVTDANGCTTEEVIYVDEAEFLIPEISGDTVICNGVAIDLTANSGFETYEWSDGTMDETQITVSASGWYYITVSDGDGCFGEDSVFVAASTPDPVITGEPAICSGEASTLDVGSWDDIQWSTGASTETITTDTAGTFTVTVTDVYGCVNTDQFTVAEDVTPEPQIAGSTSFCTGNSTILDAGPWATYEWSTGESTQTIEVSTTNTIYLTVTNVAGCEGFDTISVTESTALTPQILGDSVVCNGVAVSLDAGTGFVSYEWSDGSTTQTIDPDMADVYVVTVTDASGCTGTDAIEVLSGSPTPAINGNSEACEGGSETLTADAGYVDYEWSTGASTQTIDVAATNTYIVTVTDNLGCTGTAVFDFTINADPTPNIAGSTTFCVGSSTELDAGAGYVSYDWSGGQNGQTVTINTPGMVTVTVTDVNGCTGTSQVNVTESTELMLNVQDTAICTGDVVTLIVGNFATYEWSTTETTPTIDVSSGNTYSVTVSDASGCTGSADIVVTENTPVFANVTPTATACNTSADGSIIDFTSLITGGDAGGTWTDVTGSGAVGSFPNLDFDGVGTGQYVFEYTTNSAIAPCVDETYTVTVTIADCACASPQFDAPEDLCADAGSLDLESLFIAGVTEPGGEWTIISDPGGSSPATLSGTTFDATNADPGVYEIQYTLSGLPAGCLEFATQLITVNPPVDAGFAGQPAQVCVDIDSTINLNGLITDADAGGQWVETSVQLSTAGFDAATGTFNTAIEMPGTYTFEYTIQAIAPCLPASTTVEVVVEDEPLADAGPDGVITCDEPNAGLDASSSNGGNEYNWYLNGSLVGTGLQLMVNDSGTYELEVINTQTGCIAYDYVLVRIDGDLPVMAEPMVTSPRCVGEAAATITAMGIAGGAAPFTYTLNGQDPTSDGVYSNLSPGDYTLAVVDANGCSDQYDFTIEPATEIDGRIVGDVVVASGDEVVLTYEVTTGAADSSIWFDEDGLVLCDDCDSLVLNPSTNMDVYLTLYDANGCEVTVAVSLTLITERNVFVGNVFTPNDDGINDFVSVSGQEGTQVNLFEVFTRWGELVYRNENFPVNVPELGWDGTNNGEELMPGVYVFHASVTYADGFEENVKGDITLIR